MRRACIQLRRAAAFTLIEMLVVIAIIVGVLAMTVPLVSTLNGSRSVGAGFNVFSAALAHARELAIYNHQIAGAFVYIDQSTGRSAIVYVEPTPLVGYPPPAPLAMPDLTLFPGEDTVYMPPAVGVRVLNNNNAARVTPPDDRYLATGAILFDQNGNVTYQNYNVAPTSTLGQRLGLPAAAGGGAQTYQLNSLGAAVIYDRTAFLDQTTSGTYSGVPTTGTQFTEFDLSTYHSMPLTAPYDQDGISGGTQQSAGDKGCEEAWLDQNGMLVMVRAGDGALVQGK